MHFLIWVSLSSFDSLPHIIQIKPDALLPNSYGWDDLFGSKVENVARAYVKNGSNFRGTHVFT